MIPVYLPPELIQKMTGPWYLIKKHDSDTIRDAMRAALETQQRTHDIATAVAATIRNNHKTETP